MARRETPAQAARRMENARRWFHITPPEGVPLRFEVATLGSRFSAQMIDVGVTILGSLAIIIVLAWLPFTVGEFLGVLFALLTLAIRAPYYIFTELFWNGQTLGKRMTGLRVMAADGRGLTTHGIVARNLMKEVEVFVPGTMLLFASQLDGTWRTILMIWVAIILIIPLTNRHRQRLGDILANTYVASQPKTVLMPDLTEREDDEEFVFTNEHLEHYGRFELQTLERLLRTHPLEVGSTKPIEESIIKVAAQIRKKIGFEQPVPDHRALAFLHAFYKAQRAYLEQKQLFGEVREDKHHRESKPSDN